MRFLLRIPVVGFDSMHPWCRNGRSDGGLAREANDHFFLGNHITLFSLYECSDHFLFIYINYRMISIVQKKIIALNVNLVSTPERYII